MPDSITTALERKQYWKQDKQIKRKQVNLKNINKKSSLVKTSVIQKVAKNHPKSIEAILAQNNSETKFESMVSIALINYLKQLNKDHKFPLLHETVNNIFGEQLNDESFTKWLSCKLQIRHSKFNEYHSKFVPSTLSFLVKMLRMFLNFSINWLNMSTSLFFLTNQQHEKYVDMISPTLKK